LKYSSLEFNSKKPNQRGFTLIELVMVIVILGVLSAFALPRFANLSSDAKVATLEHIKGAMRSTISIIRSKAYVQGLTVADSNPGGGQAEYIVETEAGSSEVDWRNLCPESRAEMGDALNMRDHIDFTDGSGLTSAVDNQFTRIGYVLGATTGSKSGCYVLYDSFGDPECTVEVIIDQC
jgi:MSHA pilin protein MshA